MFQRWALVEVVPIVADRCIQLGHKSKSGLHIEHSKPRTMAIEYVEGVDGHANCAWFVVLNHVELDRGI
jgi:hypothetical protein